MTLRMVFPSSHFWICSAARAIFSISSLEASEAILILSRTLPLTCTTISISSRLRASSFTTGQSAFMMPASCPSSIQSSSAMCGAKGEMSRMTFSMASRKTALAESELSSEILR